MCDINETYRTVSVNEMDILICYVYLGVIVLRKVKPTRCLFSGEPPKTLGIDEFTTRVKHKEIQPVAQCHAMPICAL